MSSQIKLKFKVLCPLSDFNWEGNNFPISSHCIIQKLDSPPDLSRFDFLLSQADHDELFFPSHWLSFDQFADDKLSPPEKINIFLLALWVAVPTRTHVKFRFHLPNDSGYSGRASRYLDRFQWIKVQVSDQIETGQLEEASCYMDVISSVYTSYKRLYNSLVLTHQGCTTTSWQTAFICFSAATEGILTYSDKSGITKRLAKSFACLTKTTKRERDEAYVRFFHSYKIRSDIIHGRAYYMRDPDVNLKELATFSDLLRELWRSVLSSKIVLMELEKSDAEREIWFTGAERNYFPPKP